MNGLEYNDDGSVTFHIGPQRPEGKGNWLKTVPGRDWMVVDMTQDRNRIYPGSRR
jgi:hypothetical protein